MSPEEQAKLEQGMALAADVFPDFWWRMYSNCIHAGFSQRQALALVQTNILSSCTNGIRGADGVDGEKE